MGLLSKEILVQLNSQMIKRYLDLGYIIPTKADVNGIERTPRGTKLLVNIKDLPINSSVSVDVICDKCGIVKQITYSKFNKQKKINGEYICKTCSYCDEEAISKRISKRIENKGSFEDWCVKNKRLDLLKRWDYSLNTKKPNEVCKSSRGKYWIKCENGKHESEQRTLYTLTSHSHDVLCSKCRTFDNWVKDNFENDFYDKYWHESNTIDTKTIGSTSEIYAKFKCQFDHSHVYDLRIVSFKLGVRCSLCPPIIKGEKEIYDILTNRNIVFEQQKYFIGLVGLGGRKLTYDFYLPKQNILIEYHGEQHEKPVDYFGGVEAFEKQIIHDKIKASYANDNNIRLVTIWYYDFSKIEKILREELEK